MNPTPAQWAALLARVEALEAAQQQQSEPIDEAVNDRRFRDCMAAIDKATPEQIRAATPEATQEDPQTLHSVAPPAPLDLDLNAPDPFDVPRQPAPTVAAPAPAGGLVERVAEHIMADPTRELIQRLLDLAAMAVDQALDLDYDDPEDHYIYRELQELKPMATDWLQRKANATL